MGKWMLLLGIVLMGVAIVALVMGLSNSPQTTAISQSLVCKPGEKYVEELGSTVTEGTRTLGREFFAYCVGDGRRDVTPQAFAVKAGMFAVPFVAGLLLFIFGIFVMTWRGSRAVMRQVISAAGSPVTPVIVTRQPASKIVVNGQEVDAVPPEVDKILKGMFGDTMQNRGNLADRLRQLQEARDAGLISSDEYERVRQQILDSMDD
jgi:putative oligomerization/nucleic acid binding protein